MLAYAPRPERRRISPTALALIIGAHAVAIVAVMSAKMEIERHREPPIFVESLPNPPVPEPPKPHPKAQKTPKTTYTTTDPIVQTRQTGPKTDPLPSLPPVVGGGTIDPPPPPLKPEPIVRSGPHFATPPGEIRPPYPEAMRAAEKEAVLRLRLAIDEHGRVISVDPVGSANPAFLAAARRHILKSWRYAPAMEGDRAIASSTVITLEFKLDS
ncbi:energy transducer TonB [Sphingomonas alba]|uniref:TonB family protein n=1 Tax=Sphingomonas alba TaxID=2908208 RepID=A0ABT0RMJ4_9SPHN|nr:energy transducer TonB [Sphingomonas alba]MCL6683867.1 TonB family protein [Sphingomonas alba]